MKPQTVKSLLGFRQGQRWDFEKDFQVLRYQMACAAIYGDEERSKRLSEAKQLMKKWNYRRSARCNVVRHLQGRVGAGSAASMPRKELKQQG